MGYAGNFEPSYLIPTVIADSISKVNINFPFLFHYSGLNKNCISIREI
jgi:hypothetical protein